MHRVVVTGHGCISALGHGAETCWQAMRDGRSGIGPIATIPTNLLNVRVAAEVKDYEPQRHFEEKRLASLDRVAQFALIAAREAFAQAGLPLAEGGGGLAEETAAIIGIGVGGQHTQDESYRRLYGDGIARLHPLTIPRLMINAATSHITRPATSRWSSASPAPPSPSPAPARPPIMPSARRSTWSAADRSAPPSPGAARPASPSAR